MSRELLLLRHAKSDWEQAVRTDFHRPLAKRGRKDAPRVGAWLYREGLVPDVIMSSPAERARATTLHICKHLDYKKKQIVWDAAIYEASVTDLLGVLARCPLTATTVLIVGHNPGLEDLIRYLVDGDLDEPEDGKLLPTATTARLELPNDWQQLESGCAVLISITRPKFLPN